VTEQLGYIPSPTARNLKIGRTGIIGLVVGSTQGAWFHQLLTGVEEELLDKRVSVALCSLALTGTYDASAVEAWITERRVDGIIMIRATERERPLLDEAKRRDLPIVFIAPDHTIEGSHVVRSRNREAGREVARHLLDLGHRTIAFVGGPETSQDSRDRLLGLGDVLTEAGVTLQARHVSASRDYLPRSGIDYAKKWLVLPRGEAPTAVVLGNDEMALGFMGTVQSHGVKVPEDVSVVGFDNILEGELWWPGLTTSSQPARKMGREACRLLFSQMESQLPVQGSLRELEMNLVIRQSTSKAAF
jgi:LacI family transcriptional regulator